MKAAAKRVPLSWDPVRRGATYCAPACGRGCTHAEYMRANRSASALCASLGGGWKPHVWENLGWHPKAVSPTGVMAIYKHGPRNYWATTEGDNLCGQFHADGRTQREAYTKVVNSMRLASARLHELLSKV